MKFVKLFTREYGYSDNHYALDSFFFFLVQVSQLNSSNESALEARVYEFTSFEVLLKHVLYTSFTGRFVGRTQPRCSTPTSC